MSCTPTNLWDLAKAIGNSTGCGEAELRCATSRGYYAALHSVDAVIPAVEGVERVSAEGSHQFIIRRARVYGDGPNPGRLEARKIVQVLKKLKDQRVHADYELDSTFEVRDKEDALSRVHAIFGYCNALYAAIEKQTSPPLHKTASNPEAVVGAGNESPGRVELKRVF